MHSLPNWRVEHASGADWVIALIFRSAAGAWVGNVLKAVDAMVAESTGMVDIAAAEQA